MDEESYFAGADSAWSEQSLESARHYEARVATRVLRTAGVDAAAVLRTARDRRGPSAVLTLRDLDDELDLPLRLTLGRLRRLHELALSDLFRQFAKTPPVRAFLEAVADQPDAPDVAVVFRWPGVHDFMTVHDQPIARDVALATAGPRGGKLRAPRAAAIRVLGRVDRHDVTIESLDNLTAALWP